MRILAAVAICACAWSQSAMDRPQLGKMLDRSGAVRTVYGIAASVTLSGAETTGVISSACSKTFCLAKTETAIVSAMGSVDAPAGPALFAFDGDAAFVWFPESRQLARWRSGSLSPVSASAEGEVLSIGVNAGAVQFAVRRSRGDVWIVNQDGSAAGALPRASGSVILTPGGAVYATRREIVTGNVSLPLEAVTAISRMSESYLQVRAGGVDYALRIDPGRETLFQLPGAGQ